MAVCQRCKDQYCEKCGVYIGPIPFEHTTEKAVRAWEQLAKQLRKPDGEDS